MSADYIFSDTHCYNKRCIVESYQKHYEEGFPKSPNVTFTDESRGKAETFRKFVQFLSKQWFFFMLALGTWHETPPPATPGSTNSGLQGWKGNECAFIARFLVFPVEVLSHCYVNIVQTTVKSLCYFLF